MSTHTVTVKDAQQSDGEADETKSAAGLDKADEQAKATEQDKAESEGPAKAAADAPAEATASRTGIAGRLRGLADRPITGGTIVRTLAVVAVVALIAVLAWQYTEVRSELNGMKDAAADRIRAEEVALEYATGAAEMNYENPGEWRARLTEGTAPELADRMDAAATSMEQLIIPLQWSSTATPIAARVDSQDGDVFVVQAFVNIMTTNSQAPDGIESTATYQLSIDKADDWLITDISGVGAGLAGQEAPR